MFLRPFSDMTVAEWISHARVPSDQLIDFGPPGLDAYARLRYIPDPSSLEQAEADVQHTADRLTEIEQTARAIRLLAPFTSTPDQCFFCVWDGWPTSQWMVEESTSFVELSDRRYALRQGTLNEFDAWATTRTPETHSPPPAFIWPADHAWCFASDVDPHWAGIGAAKPAVTALLRDAVLDAVTADPTRRHPVFSP